MTPQASSPHSPSARFRLPEFACLLLFAGLSLYGLMHHELWRDETQAWLIVRESHSLAQLLENIRYDGHPALWFMALFALPEIQQGFLPAQVLHYLIALASAALLLFCSPFSRLERCLLLFGYFMLYEYTVIARNYGAGALLLWAFCLSCRYLPRNAWLPGLVLGVLANTSMMGCLVAIAGALALGTAALSGAWTIRARASLATGLVLAAAGILAAAITMAPPPISPSVVAGCSASMPIAWQWSGTALHEPGFR